MSCNPASGKRDKYLPIGVKYLPMRWTPRVTVAAIIEQQGRFLMVEESENKKAVISQPAGHLEKGESLLQAVVREVQEETAWQFVPQALTGIYRWEHATAGVTYLRFCFCGQVKNHDPQQALDHGILGTHWLSYEELQASKLRSPVVARCLQDYLAGNRYPLSLYTDLSSAELMAAQT